MNTSVMSRNYIAPIVILISVDLYFASAKNRNGPPQQTQDVVNIVSRVGEDVKLVCPISGYPEPFIEWKKVKS